MYACCDTRFTQNKPPILGFSLTVIPQSLPYVQVTVGADHRVVDGAMVARFCNEWKGLVEKPELLLLHMR